VRTIAQIDAELARLKAEKRALKPVVSLAPGFKRSRSFRPEGEGQRQPRVRDNGHLAFIRRLPCVAAFARTGAQVFGCDAAHVRFGDPARGKRHTGMAEKPDDKWTLPLTRAAHTEQHGQSERAFWSALGIDPIALCEALYAASGDERAALQIIRGARNAQD
jgi:hypothetical protein